jgi:endonuclease/exonuclease/phosphatase family metal-dependent hydrolase
MRIVTYNVHSCRGPSGRLSPECIAEVIAETRADVACLQEVDMGRRRTGRVPQAEVIARTLGMDFHFFPAMRAGGGEYGEAILSRHPLKVVRCDLLPHPFGTIEPRGALWVEISAAGKRWQVLNTHLSLGRRARHLQARALGEWIAEAAQQSPTVFCGDLNSRRGSRVHQFLGSNLREVQTIAAAPPQRTFATFLPWICLDYIYISPGIKILEATTIVTPLTRRASDHFPLVADLEQTIGASH